MNRRDFLGSALAAVAYGVVKPRRAVAEPAGPMPDVLFIQLMANGGWDQALHCDPKPGLRSSVKTASQVEQAGNIPFAVPDTYSGPKIRAFFQAHHTRLTVFNGVDTSTNNHEVGLRYSTSGSQNVGWPIFAAQVAAVYGRGRPMPMLDLGGYDETGELFAPTRLNYENTSLLSRLRHPEHFSGDWFRLANGQGEGYPEADYLPAGVRDVVRIAREARLSRQKLALKLPADRAAIDQLAAAREGARRLGELDLPGYIASDAESLAEVGMRAFKAGLAVTINMDSGGFDTHGGNGGDDAQSAAAATIFERASALVARADTLGVPVCVVLCSDFGRTPYTDSGGGTDHWPTSSIVLLQNALAAAKTGLPTDRVIGASTDGSATQALKAVKLDPRTLQPSDTGVVVTPGHVMRALRRVAKVADSPVLGRFPIALDGPDLDLG